MDKVRAQIARFTARQHGVVARWQTQRAGISDEAVDELVKSGELLVVYRGVYRLRGVPYTQDLRWLAAVLAGGPGARLSHLAAASFHQCGITRVVPTITIPHDRECEAADLDVRRSRRDGDVIVVRGISVTTIARTVLDCATELGTSYEDFVQNVVTSGRIDIERLFAILDRKGGRGVEGTVALRSAISGGLDLEGIQRRLELLVARVIDSANVPKPVRQHPLVCADGREVVLDNAWPGRRLTIEAAGRRWHGNKAQVAHDRARARSIVASGWERYEYGWSDAEVPDAMRREIESFWAGLTGVGPVNPAQNGEEDRNDRGEESAA